MKNPPLLPFADDIPRRVIALGTEYRDGQIIAPHNHRRGQLLYGSTGVVMMVTRDGAWVMPPERGMWIPPQVIHEVHMLGRVKIQSLYLLPEAAEAMPARCQVVGISPLMRNLLTEAVALPRDGELNERDAALMRLVEHEMHRLPTLPLSLPLPKTDPLLRLCRSILVRPTPHSTIDEWSETLGLSRRSFTRLFRRETGLSFVAWRQQACLMAALPRLAAGEAVTAVAIDLGYDNPAAFTTMFKRVLGTPPRTYLERQAAPAEGSLGATN